MQPLSLHSLIKCSPHWLISMHWARNWTFCRAKLSICLQSPKMSRTSHHVNILYLLIHLFILHLFIKASYPAERGCIPAVSLSEHIFHQHCSRMANGEQHLHIYVIKPLLTQYPPAGTAGKSISNTPGSAAVISPSLLSVNRLSPSAPAKGCRWQKAEAALTFPFEQLTKIPFSPCVITTAGRALSGVCQQVLPHWPAQAALPSCFAAIELHTEVASSSP